MSRIWRRTTRGSAPMTGPGQRRLRPGRAALPFKRPALPQPSPQARSAAIGGYARAVFGNLTPAKFARLVLFIPQAWHAR
jgi:hypothetical protein